MSDIRLNSAQQKAVDHDKGPLLVIAGAGTGKTRVITQRVANLIKKKKVRPEEILALTFTQKAAGEMEERIDIAMPYGYGEVWISTFHSFCDRVLRQDAIHIGIDSGYLLMSQSQEYLFFRKNLFNFSLDRFRPHGNPTKFVREILKHFSRLGDEDVRSDEYEKFLKTAAKAKDFDGELKKDYKELSRVYKEYVELKEKESKLGFSDLTLYALKLFRERPAVLERYKKQFKYILVDEFQDTNYIQNEMLKLIAGKNGNITVVGDDDQAIYKFRGAAVSNILDFKKSFPGCENVVLVENYRSCQEILDEAYNLIQSNNPDRLEVAEKIDKKLRRVFRTDSDSSNHPDSQLGMSISTTGRCPDECVRRIHARTDIEESELVAKEIKKLVEKSDLGIKYSDIALLVRANSHTDQFIKSFKYHGIHFTFPGPKGLYSRPEVKDLIAFLRIFVDYSDDISMFRILTLKSSTVSAREFVDLRRAARKRKISLFELLEELTDIKAGAKKVRGKEKSDQEENKRGSSDNLPGEEKSLLEDILSKKSIIWVKRIMNSFSGAFEMIRYRKKVGEVLYEMVTKSGYIDNLIDDKSVQNEWKVQNVGKFFNLLKKFEHETDDAGVFEYMDYLEYSLEVGENPMADPVDMADFDAVNILTLHGAKGLEFPVVFMVNLVSDRFPTRNRADVLPIPDGLIKEILPEGDEHIQEERRLFYVGMTRAEKLLYLTSADYYGEGVRKKRQSIFLHDLGKVMEIKDGEDDIAGQEGEKLGLYRPTVDGDESELPPDLRKSTLKYIVRNLSYSHIASYQNCPYQFYFRYFLNVPGAESQAKSFGMTIHNTLKEFYECLRNFKQGLPGVNKEPDMGQLLDIYKKKWQSAGYESKKQEKLRYESGKKSLKSFYDRFYRPSDEDPVWLEERFRINFGDFWMKGTIDRLDRVPGGLALIDYKTGKVPSNIKAAQKDLQLAIYSLAVEKLKKEKVSKASFVYVESQKVIDVKIDADLRQKALDEIVVTLEEIKNARFEPKPGYLCKFCDYRHICDYAIMG